MGQKECEMDRLRSENVKLRAHSDKLKSDIEGMSTKLESLEEQMDIMSVCKKHGVGYQKSCKHTIKLRLENDRLRMDNEKLRSNMEAMSKEIRELEEKVGRLTLDLVASETQSEYLENRERIFVRQIHNLQEVVQSLVL